MKRVLPTIVIVVVVCGVGFLFFPWLQKSCRNAERVSCVSNLMMIDAAKEQYALASGATNGTIVALSDILPYLGDLKHMRRGGRCPRGR